MRRALLALLLAGLPVLAATGATLRIDGEVHARKSSALMPPAVDTPPTTQAAIASSS